MATKTCTKCKVEKSLDNFSSTKNGKDGKRTQCKTCTRDATSQYGMTLTGCLRNLLKAAKWSSKRRLANGRIGAGVFELKFADLESLWKKQDGKCYYSNIQMNYNSFDWKVSLERLDTKVGYIKDNIVLTCIEFNSRTQWSVEKVMNMLHLLKQDTIFIEHDFKSVSKNRKQYGKVKKTLINNIDHYNCNHCNEVKPHDKFVKDIKSGCKDCVVARVKFREDLPRGALQRLLRSSKSTTKNRETTHIEKRDNTFDIDFDFLVELYNNQKGLCVYSGIPLIFKANEDWHISLERSNPLKGYTKDNVCLICCEFNTSDKSVMYKNNNLGNSAWSKDKFALFVKKATEKYCNDDIVFTSL